jgi:hypothetical protein
VSQLFDRLPSKLARQRFNRVRLGWLHSLLPRFLLRLPVSTTLRMRLLCRVMTPFHHPACSRYFRHYLHLQRYSSCYDKVLLSDVRDVLFQADPFVSPAASRGTVFLEHDATHGCEHSNDLWVSVGYGEEGLSRLRGRRVSCSGTTLGPTAAMLVYLERMVCELALRARRFCGCDGVDQGVHNWLYWTGNLPGFEGCENFRGPVLTMSGLPRDRIRFDAQGYIVGPDEQVVPVLHQYDRFPDLAPGLLRSYKT